MQYPDTFDVIVIGGGHAGTEASLASARMGCSTLLLTHNIETLGQMSCNPAIGGIGKSHLVKEIDALGGAMALATDLGGIQFRVLNARKGPAVRATRAQADRVRYKAAIRDMLENQPNLTIFQQGVDDLIIDGDRVTGAVTQMGLRFSAKTVVVTAGTFLAGKIHIGLENHAAGRAGDPPAENLAKRLRELPFRVERLKTGTPPRIDARSVDFTHLPEQWGDKQNPLCRIWVVLKIIRRKPVAGLLIQTQKPMRLFMAVWIVHQCTPVLSMVLDQDTVPPSKIRWCVLLTKINIRYLLSLRD